MALVTISYLFLLALALAGIDEQLAAWGWYLTDFAWRWIVIGRWRRSRIIIGWRRIIIIGRRVVIPWSQAPAYDTSDNQSGKEPASAAKSIGLFGRY
jgi:hypothetical protein